MTETKSLAEALSMLQAKLPRIEKALTARVKSEKGSYSYSYADLAHITRELMPLLGEVGLAFIAKPTLIGDRFVLEYRLVHVSGESEDGQYPLPSNGTPQAIGSAITYARRYCLCAVTGVAPEDDDGAAAEAENLRPAARPEPPAKQTTDHGWLTDIEKRIEAAGTLAELETLASEVEAKRLAGACEEVHYQHLHTVGRRRVNELNGASA